MIAEADAFSLPGERGRDSMKARLLHRIGRRRLGISAGIFAVVWALAASAVAQKADAAPEDGTRGPPVVVAEVVEQRLPIERTYVGTTAAPNAVDLQAQVSGYLVERRFTEGAMVEAGTTLFVIDPRPFQAIIAQKQAQLEEQQAVSTYADAAQRRYAAAAKLGAAAQDQLDQAVELQMKATAAISLYQAELEQAKLDLEFAEVKAPFSGRVGRALVNVGALVKNSQTVLASLVQTDPIYVYFSPPAADLPSIEAHRDKETLEVTVTLPQVHDDPLTGALTFISNVADAATGTIAVRATIKDPPQTVRPGQFARVRLKIPTDADVLTVPAGAIARVQGQPYAMVVDADSRVERRNVGLGRYTSGRDYIIETGLRKGERVVVSGTGTLKAGEFVSVQPATGR